MFIPFVKIIKRYFDTESLKQLIQDDLHFIKELSMADNHTIQDNMPEFVNTASRYGIDMREIMSNVFGQKYYNNRTEPLTWYYYVQNKLQFVGADLARISRDKLGIVDNLILENIEGQIKVCCQFFIK